MADNKDVKKLMGKLRDSIDSGIELFKQYKEMSKVYSNTQTDIKKNLDNKLKNINERKINKALTEKNKKLSNMLNIKLENSKKHYKEISETTLVDTNKSFLKYKKEIRIAKKKILSNILKIETQLRKIMDLSDFKKLIERLYKTKYEVSNSKTITFKTLLHHLESGQVSENVAKTVKQIEELGSIKNVTNRKKQMEIGIKKKEIEKLLKEYNKTNKISKELIEKEITKLVKSLNRINNAKEKEKITTKIDKLSRSLQNEMTNKERKIKYEIQIKMQELKELEKSS
jgi:hypothetical protein